MRTKIFVIVWLLTILGPAHAQSRRSRNVSTSSVDNRPVTDCGQIRVQFDRRDALRDEDQLTIPRSQVSALQVRPASNTGMYINGWNGNDYVVKTCKAAPADDPYAANETFRNIVTTNSNGRITTTGPRDREWDVYLIILSPRDAALDLETANGPIGLNDVNGRIRAQASNGPVSLRNVSGEVDVTTSNGPIHLAGGSGNHHLNATNGPIHVQLSSSRWDGTGLEANTQNGPLTISLPDGFSSGVRINTSGSAPVRCRASQCDQGIRRLSNPSLIEIGGPAAVIRLSTVNGPVSIEPER